MSEFKDITPVEFACSYSASCPSVHISEDGKTLLIVGSGAYWDGEAAGIPIGPGETALWISTDLVRSALEGNNARK